jgi:hypothetical protein
MKDQDSERRPRTETDDLDGLLAHWRAPDVPRTVDDRLLASYRSHVDERPLWRRLFTATIRVPVPLAAAALIALILSVALAWNGAAPADVQRARARRLDTPVITHTSLAGFEPVSQSDGTVVLGTSP